MQETNYLSGKGELYDKLKRLPFLSALDPDHLKDMLKLSKLCTYQTDEIIATEGTYDSHVYVIVYGSVSVTKQGRFLANLSDSGDTFGELAVIDGCERSATVTADLETLVLSIDASFMDRLPEEKKSTFYAIYYRLLTEILAQRLRDTDKELIETKAELESIKQQACVEVQNSTVQAESQSQSQLR